MRGTIRRTLVLLGAIAPLLLLFTTPAGAQPFGAWMTMAGHPTHGYIEIPSSPALNPVGGFTFEAWVAISDPGGCSSIAGKGYTETWWVGICGTTLRSYLKGFGSDYTIGEVPPGQWTHVAVTWDGATRRHYINGELVGSQALGGPLTTNSDPVQIASDPDWPITPPGAIDEVRIWTVARTIEQIRESINVPITSPQTGLSAVWPLDGSPVDVVGGHDGAVGGSGIGVLTFPVAIGCSGTDQILCVRDRFAIRTSWRDFEDATGPGSVVPYQTDESGLFTFFSPTNWEIQVKVLDGCGLNGHYWVFSAATTNVFYRMEVFDMLAGVNKVYFNYPGPPAPAVTDVNALQTCP